MFGCGAVGGYYISITSQLIDIQKNKIDTIDFKQIPNDTLIAGLSEFAFGKAFKFLWKSGKYIWTGKSVVKNTSKASSWYKVSSADDSLAYHYSKHGTNVSPQQYTDDAINFYNKYKSQGAPVQLNDGTAGIKLKKVKDANGIIIESGGYYTLDGKIITFWYK